VTLGAVASACGGGDNDGGGGGGGGTGFTAVVAGDPWEAEEISIVAQANAGVQGSILIQGTDNSGATNRSITLTLYNVRGPGTYPLGVGSEVYGGRGSTGEGTGGGDADLWSTPNSGVAGTVELTQASGGRVVGTFEFTGEATDDNIDMNDRTVTDGEFDLPLTGTLTTLPANQGSKVSARLNGRLYNAWGVNGLLTDFTGGPGIRVTTSTGEDGLEVQLVGVTATGTYAISDASPLRIVTVGRNGGDAQHCCWGLNEGGDVGTITVTGITPDRVQGTFSGTLQPHAGAPATAPLVVTEGSFDVGIE
jgi:hypothetical protein